jgi:hypothetical protein
LSEVTPHSRTIQSLDETYALLRTAGTNKQPVAAMYEGHPRLFCLHVLGKSRQGRRHAFCYQFGGSSDSGLRTFSEGVGVGAALWWRNSVELSCNLGYGTRRHDRIDKLVLRRSNSTPTLRAAKIHSKDNEAIAALASAPSSYGVWRSSGDYAALGVFGDPRGRNSGTGLGVTNPR